MNTVEADIRNNDIITEALTEMMMDQEPSQRIGYMRYAMEAMVRPETQNQMLDKLYRDVAQIESVDFGKIPDSKGDITKYVYYQQMYDSIELINRLCEGSQTPNVVTMNKLHQILLDAVPDFTFGFRANDFVVTSTYKCLVKDLYEMINICIVDATAHLRKKLTGRNEMKANEVRMMTKTVNNFIKIYESGQWSIIMKTLKTNGKVIAVESFTHTGFAVESNGQTLLTNLAMEPAEEGNLTDMINGAETLANGIKAVPGAVKNLGTAMWEGIKKLPTGAKVVGIIIALWFIIRVSIKLFFKGSAKIKDCVEQNSEIIKANIANDMNQSEDAIEKQRDLLQRMEKTSDVIEYKILKAEKEARKELAEENKSNYSGSELKQITGSDFAF